MLTIKSSAWISSSRLALDDRLSICRHAFDRIPRRGSNLQDLATRAFRIDRRLHMDLAWQRQEQYEERARSMSSTLLNHGANSGEVLEIENLRQMEQVRHSLADYGSTAQSGVIRTGNRYQYVFTWNSTIAPNRFRCWSQQGPFW